MVKQRIFNLASIVVFGLFPEVLFGATSMKLSQNDVTKLVIEKSYKAQETNLKYQQMQLTPYQKLASYDWILSADSGYERDRNEGPLHPSTLTNQTYKTNLRLKKSLLTGTTLSFEYSRNSLYGNDTDISNPKVTQYTYDLLGVSVEQNLWKNFFGVEDRAALESLELVYQSNVITRENDLQALVLESLRLYWDAYIAQENFREALSAKERYQRFVAELQKKTRYGYSNSYELFQVQAELENREQLVKKTSFEYLNKLDALNQLLNLTPDTRIEFPKIEIIPDPPKLAKRTLQEARQIRSQSLKIEAAESALIASRSGAKPVLTINGTLYSSGFDEQSSIAESHLLSGVYPKYYIGMKFLFQFGSGYSGQDQFNKKVSLDLEQAKYQRLVDELQNNLISAERKIQTTFFNAYSTKKQIELREKALSATQRSFDSGRIDINFLIEAMNKFFTAKIDHVRAVGDYFIALNEWAALNDELMTSREVNP